MAELIATVTAGLWAGAAWYIGFVEHPSALRVGVQFATEYFRPMSMRAAPAMIVLAFIGAIAGGAAWLGGSSIIWLLGGLLLASMLPLTVVFIVPTNRRLLKIDAVAAAEDARQLHLRWGRLHFVRTALGSVPFLLFVWLLTLDAPGYAS